MFEIVQNPLFYIWEPLKRAMYEKFSFKSTFWQENSNVVEITRGSLSFEKHLPIDQYQIFFGKSKLFAIWTKGKSTNFTIYS